MKALAFTGMFAAILAIAVVTANPVTAGPMGESGPSASSPSASSLKAKPKKGARITTGDSAYGTMLFDRNQQAIYIFDLEKSNRSKCYGACAEAWPPVLAKGRPKALGKVRQRLLGTTRRKGGAKQVTYAGQPLYYYAHEGPGQVFCHDVFGFGGTWLVVKPNGKAAD